MKQQALLISNRDTLLGHSFIEPGNPTHFVTVTSTSLHMNLSIFIVYTKDSSDVTSTKRVGTNAR